MFLECLTAVKTFLLILWETFSETLVFTQIFWKKMHFFQEAFFPPCLGWEETLHRQWKRRMMHILTAQVTPFRSGRFYVGPLHSSFVVGQKFSLQRQLVIRLPEKIWIVLKSNRTTTRIVITESLLKNLYWSSCSVRILLITRITRTSTVPKLK